MSLGSSARLRALVGNRDLRFLLAAALVSQIGDWILATGVAFQVYALTGSTVATAAVLLTTQIPQVLLSSPAGTLVDRWDRRRVMITVNLALAVALVPLLAVQRAEQLWIVLLVVAVTSCLTPFFLAAEASLLPALVDRDGLVTANAANAQVRNIARLVGAAIGGVLVAVGGFMAVALADLASFALAALLLSRIRHRAQPRATGPRAHLVRDWIDGLTVIRRSRNLSVVLGFFALAGLGEAIMGTLFAPFVQDVLGGDGAAFGAILSAQAVGGIVGGLIVTAVGHRFSPRVLFGAGAAVFGLLDLVLFLYPLVLPGVVPAIVVIAAVGLPGAAMSAGVLTVFQLATAEQVRGRVFGTVMAGQNAAMLLSTLAAGALAARYGIIGVIAIQGAAYLIGGVVVLLVLRSDPLGETGGHDALQRPPADGRRPAESACPRPSPADRAARSGRARRHVDRGGGGTTTRHQSRPGQSPSAPAREVRVRRAGGGQ